MGSEVRVEKGSQIDTEREIKKERETGDVGGRFSSPGRARIVAGFSEQWKGGRALGTAAVPFVESRVEEE